MQLLKILFLLIVLVAVIEAQKGGTKTKQRPQNVPPPPSPRKTPQPTKQPRPAPQRPQEDDSGSAGNAIEENNEGESGPEPPALVPQTSFTCEDKPYQPGMYADMEVDCSVYHMCFDGRKESFLCGTGTMFNQEILSCDHPGKVNCASSPQYYDANTELGKPGAEPSNDSGSKGSVAPQQPQPRPRIQSSKTSPQRPRSQPQPQPQPRPQPQPQPQPQPFVDDEPDDEPEAPAPAPVPQPQPRPRTQPSKTSAPKPAPRSQPAPRKAPQPKKTPIVQSYDDNEGESNVRRAYRARY